jgi:flagellar basal-body rod modification protein FlgD
MASTVDDKSMSALMDTMNAKKTSTKKSAVEETQDRFMTLLVTQMKNQDPMNPLDNAQVTSQFAQLSTVTGIDKLNDSLANMMASYQNSQTLQAASMIGHGILAPGFEIDLLKSSALMGAELSGDADKVTVTIRDAYGAELNTLEMGAQKAGSLPIAWDGKTKDGNIAPDGKYTFSVSATRNGAEVKASALQFGLVETVSTGANGVKLNAGSLGSLDLADVRQIL